MSSINNNPALKQQQKTAPVRLAPASPLPVQTPRAEEATIPSESFTPAKLPETPRADAATTPEKPAPRAEAAGTLQVEKKLTKPREGSDMAIMLEDMEAAKLAGGDLKGSSTGALFVNQDGLISMGTGESSESKGKEQPQTLEKMLSSMAAESSAKAHSELHGSDHHGGGHGPGNDIAMGGHLGTEIVEKIGHHAHHAVEHGAGHAAATVKGQAAGHAAATVKGQAAGHGAATVKGHAVEHAADVAEAAGIAKAHGAHGATQAAGAHGTGEVSGAHEVSAGAAEHGAEAAGHLSTGLTTALGVSAAASAGIGGYMLYVGGKELKHGIKEKDAEKIAEGVGGLAVGTRSVAASTVMASMVSGSSTLANVASVASQALTPLGVVHGAIDVGLGVKDLVKGDKVDGMIKVGFGASVIAGAIVGGIPLAATALALLGVKVGRGVYKAKQTKKAAEAEQTQPKQVQAPVAPPTTEASSVNPSTAKGPST